MERAQTWNHIGRRLFPFSMVIKSSPHSDLAAPTLENRYIKVSITIFSKQSECSIVLQRYENTSLSEAVYTILYEFLHFKYTHWNSVAIGPI